jgi:hypothetical protein
MADLLEKVKYYLLNKKEMSDLTQVAAIPT